MDSFLTLAVETSCDETAAAVVRDGHDILSDIIASQIPKHRLFGGVVPEIAARHHLSGIIPVIGEALQQAGVTLQEIGLVAVTSGPGLVGALLVGVAVAKSIAYARGLPLVAVNHVEGHIYANMLEYHDVEPPLLCLTVSGGHTDLLYMKEFGDYRLLARTRDDAAGEALDKVARVLGLGYPGGPELETLARQGTTGRLKMPQVQPDGDSLDFSFSGLKTAAIQLIHKKQELDGWEPADLAASFQQAVVQQLVDRLVRASRLHQIKTVLVSGGVAANQALRDSIRTAAEENDLKVYIPRPRLCTDNAAMIASAGFFRFMRQGRHGDGLDVNAYPEMRLV